MSDLTWLLDPYTGDLVLEGLSTEEIAPLVADLLPLGWELFCAAPLALLHLAPASSEEITQSSCVRIAGYYHHSLIEGPGRRSTVKMQGCTIACRGFISSMIAARGVPAVGDTRGVIRYGCTIRHGPMSGRRGACLALA
jgi:hypothetical protein